MIMKSHLRQLISEVKERQPLWDRNHEMRHERALIDALWNEVAVMLGLSKSVVKTKWKTLKDTYRKEAKRIVTEPNHKPTWAYYNSLYFLYPQLKIETSTISSSENQDNNSSSSVLGADESKIETKIEFVYDNVNMDNEEDTKESLAIKGVKRKYNDNEGDLVDDDTTTEQLKNDDYFEDEDMCFFKSLVPHVKQLSAQKKMLMRMKIQEIVYKEVYSSDLDDN